MWYYSNVRSNSHRSFALQEADIAQFQKSVDSLRENPDYITDILDIYAPANGRILDPYAGTLTTAIDCMNAKRRFVGI